MKKYILLGLAGLIFIISSLYAAKNFSEKPRLERALLDKAIRFDAKFDPEQDKSFRQIIQSAQDIYLPKSLRILLPLKIMMVGTL